MGKGWSGNSEGHKKTGSAGGKALLSKHGKEHFSKIGKIGGKNKYDKWKFRKKSNSS